METNSRSQQPIEQRHLPPQNLIPLFQLVLVPHDHHLLPHAPAAPPLPAAHPRADGPHTARRVASCSRRPEPRRSHTFSSVFLMAVIASRSCPAKSRPSSEPAT